MLSTCLALSFWPLVIVVIWLVLRWRAKKAAGLRPLLLERLAECEAPEAARRAVTKSSADAWSFGLSVGGRKLNISLTPSVLPARSTVGAAQIETRLRGVDQSLHPRWLNPLLANGVRGSVDPTGLAVLVDVDLRSPGSLRAACADTVASAAAIEAAWRAAISAGERPPEDPGGAGP